ncbi:MAG: caspase family protein [Candidatus Latescibacteria bacterium]|nr:caspase family protein [Candidatus Latescibacterota bacterium]
MAKRALCIGINNYPGTGSDLAGCVNDAKDWAALLKAKGFQVTTLLDSKSTLKGMRDAIEGIVSSAKSGDTIIVQYSGHGSYIPDVDGDEPDGTDECLCPYDVDRNGPLSDDELFDIYDSRVRGSKIIMISDSCHSGSVTKFAPIVTPPTMAGRSAPQRKVRFLPPEVFLSSRDMAKLGTARRALHRSSTPGRYASLLLAGCQDYEYSYDAYFNGRPNGAFSFVALRALKKVPSTATYRDWFKKIRAVLPSQQYPQTPNLFGSTRQRKWRALA